MYKHLEMCTKEQLNKYNQCNQYAQNVGIERYESKKKRVLNTSRQSSFSIRFRFIATNRSKPSGRAKAQGSPSRYPPPPFLRTISEIRGGNGRGSGENRIHVILGRPLLSILSRRSFRLFFRIQGENMHFFAIRFSHFATQA